MLNEKKQQLAAARFTARAVADGYKIVGAYTSARAPVELICPEGHEWAPTPTNFNAGKRCRFCAKRDSAEGRFRDAVEAQGGRVWGPYVNSQTPTAVTCANGHEVEPRPGNVLSGQGICRFCKTSSGVHDAFYVVTGQGCVKFGISVGTANHRLWVHRRDGYGTVERLWTGLPGTLALDVEREVARVLAWSGHAPFRGREYFRGSALPAVLSVAERMLPRV